MIGRINHFKGQDHFIEVARRLVSNNPGLRFVMVGGCVPGKEEDLSKIKMLRKKYNLENHIRIEDFRNGISDVYNALDIFVLPSTLPDPFPTVILEAMAMKKPIVANALGGSTEMIIHGETGFLVPADQPQQMAEYIEGLAIDPDLRNSMGTKAQERFTYCFSLERFIDQWEAVYKELLDSSK
jgi:glycosyltransferase involved in cell wall biosynthesis